MFSLLESKSLFKINTDNGKRKRKIETVLRKHATMFMFIKRFQMTD